jgi:hypothetical protein
MDLELETRLLQIRLHLLKQCLDTLTEFFLKLYHKRCKVTGLYKSKEDFFGLTNRHLEALHRCCFIPLAGLRAMDSRSAHNCSMERTMWSSLSACQIAPARRRNRWHATNDAHLSDF